MFHDLSCRFRGVCSPSEQHQVCVAQTLPVLGSCSENREFGLGLGFFPPSPLSQLEFRPEKLQMPPNHTWLSSRASGAPWQDCRWCWSTGGKGGSSRAQSPARASCASSSGHTGTHQAAPAARGCCWASPRASPRASPLQNLPEAEPFQRETEMRS